ncbi:MAG TPA: hypothetical protein VMH02_08775 [Verrucomicrobiae bacterium]|nr:hypothetical protein [Verrucomicrobiae bacterium]
MRKGRFYGERVNAAVGYAADERGWGVAYARLADGDRLLRVAFPVRRVDGSEREVGYAALAAVAHALRERQAGAVCLTIADRDLVDDVNGRRDLPEAVVLPYVRLRCALNAFAAVELRTGDQAGDLTQRARAEVALHVAA